MLSKHGNTNASVGLPAVPHHDAEYHRLLATFDTADMRPEAADEVKPQLNAEQRAVFRCC